MRTHKDRQSLLDDLEWEILWGTHTGNVPFPWIQNPWIGVDKEGIIDLEGRFHVRHLMTILQSVGKKLNPPFLYGDPVFRAKGRMITDRGGNEICTTHSSDLAEFIARTLSIGRFVETSHPGAQECKITLNRDDVIATLQRGGPPCVTDVMVEAVTDLVDSVLVGYNGELKAILDNMEGDGILVREGGGPADYIASLALSVMKLRKSRDLLYRFARHVRNTDEIPPPKWGADGMELLAELRKLDPARYDAEVKRGVPKITVPASWVKTAQQRWETQQSVDFSELTSGICELCAQDVPLQNVNGKWIHWIGGGESNDCTAAAFHHESVQRWWIKGFQAFYNLIAPKWWDGIPDIDGLYWAHKDMGAEYPVNELMELKEGGLFLWTARHEETKKVDWREDFVGAKFFGPLPQPPTKNQS